MFDVKDTNFFELEDEAFDTIIENDISFSGNIEIKKTFMIRGKIKGTINSISDLVIDSGAIVEADIKANRVLIRGTVKGNVNGEKLVFVTSSGSLDGDVSTQKIVLEPGCVFTGRCSMISSDSNNLSKNKE